MFKVLIKMAHLYCTVTSRKKASHIKGKSEQTDSLKSEMAKLINSQVISCNSCVINLGPP